jgi:hypothetical protein
MESNIWSALTKTQKCVVTLWYSPCDYTPTSATVAVTTGWSHYAMNVPNGDKNMLSNLLKLRDGRIIFSRERSDNFFILESVQSESILSA